MSALMSWLIKVGSHGFSENGWLIQWFTALQECLSLKFTCSICETVSFIGLSKISSDCTLNEGKRHFYYAPKLCFHQIDRFIPRRLCFNPAVPQTSVFTVEQRIHLFNHCIDCMLWGQASNLSLAKMNKVSPCFLFICKSLTILTDG